MNPNVGLIDPANPTDGTYWFDLASSSYGLFEWSQTNQKFTTISPTLITAVTDLVGNSSTGAPKTSIGSQGDYVINTTHVSNKIYYKNASNAWVQVGSQAWSLSHPFLTVASGTTVTGSATMNINGVTVTTGGTALSNVATAINNAKAGQVRFRTDKNGIIHGSIGKVTFDNEKIKANASALIEELKKLKPASAKGIFIGNISISSTMGPGIKINPGELA